MNMQTVNGGFVDQIAGSNITNHYYAPDRQQRHDELIDRAARHEQARARVESMLADAGPAPVLLLIGLFGGLYLAGTVNLLVGMAVIILATFAQASIVHRAAAAQRNYRSQWRAHNDAVREINRALARL